jgi:hypothetical protein
MTLLTILLPILVASESLAATYSHDVNGNLTQITSPVASKPVVTAQPVDWFGIPGSTAVFAVRTVPDATNTFQWKKNGVAIAGATAESLSVLNVSTTDEGLYSVAVSNPKGTVTSRAARLAIDSDSDGMADWQEKALFGGLTQVGRGDFDLDGITNAEEIADGTSPTNRTSRYYRLALLAPNGTIRAAPESATGRYAPGTRVVLTAKPMEGYSFIEWQGHAAGFINPVAVAMSSDVTVAAVFGSTLGVALDAPELTWMTDAAYPWLPTGLAGAGKVNTSVDDDWAESSPLNGLGQSWVATYVEGPATVSYRWQMPVTAAAATLRAYIDTALASTATADGVWRQTSISVGTGRHLVRWVLDRPVGGTGTDMARLDEVIVSTSASVSLAQAVDAGELPWATNRMIPWFGTNQGSHDGADTASCILTGQNQESWIETRVEGAGQMTFWYRQSGATVYNVQVDGGTAQALGSGWTKFTLNITTLGTHIIRWNANTINNSATGKVSASIWLDEVVWIPKYVATAVAAISINAALDNTALAFTTGGTKPWAVTTLNLRDGVDAMQAGTLGDKAESWVETKVTGPIRVSFYWRVQCDPTDKLQVLVDGLERGFITGTTAWAQTFVDITDQGFHTVRWRYLKDAATKSGLDTAWLDTVTTGGLGLSAPTVGTLTPTLADAVDKTTLGVRTGGNASWATDSTTSHDGVDSARSGVIANSQETWMQTAVTGAGKLTFWWRTSCEETFDYLAVQIDGVEQARISGVQDWQQKTITLVATSTHTIRWRYVKDANLSSGLDRAWVDQIEWAGAVPTATANVAPLALNVGPQAGNYSLYITEAGAWTTLETLPWATLSSSGSTGNATITVSVLAQTSAAKRSGLLTVAGWTISLTQNGYSPPVISAPIVEAILGTGASYSLSGFSGVNFPITWLATGLPPGLTINAGTGAISGTPTKAGRYTASITAKNPGGTSAPVKIVFIVRGPTLPLFSGAYSGLINAATPLTNGLGGSITINATNATSATGSLTLGGTKYPFAGTIIPNIAGNQRLTTSVSLSSTTTAILAIDFDINRWIGRATGTVTGLGETLEFTAWKNTWNATTNPATVFAGYFTSVLLPSTASDAFPQGYGHMEWTVANGGTVVIAGKAADGSSLTGAAVLWPDGQVPFFKQLYAATGTLYGTALFGTDRTVSGGMTWAKKAQPAKARDYESGFSATAVSLQGAEWKAPAPGLIVFDLPDAAANATIVFANGGIESAGQFSDVDQLLRITKKNSVVLSSVPATNPTGMKVTINASKGLFSGTLNLTDSGVKRPVAFDGVLLSNSNEGRGWFVLPELPLGSPASSNIKSGGVLLTPSP